jgi:hypothetical protein
VPQPESLPASAVPVIAKGSLDHENPSASVSSADSFVAEPSLSSSATSSSSFVSVVGAIPGALPILSQSCAVLATLLSQQQRALAAVTAATSPSPPPPTVLSLSTTTATATAAATTTVGVESTATPTLSVSMPAAVGASTRTQVLALQETLSALTRLHQHLTAAWMPSPSSAPVVLSSTASSHSAATIDPTPTTFTTAVASSNVPGPQQTVASSQQRVSPPSRSATAPKQKSNPTDPSRSRTTNTVSSSTTRLGPASHHPSSGFFPFSLFF